MPKLWRTRNFVSDYRLISFRASLSWVFLNPMLIRHPWFATHPNVFAFCVHSVFILCWSPFFVWDLLQVWDAIPVSQTTIAISTFIQSLAPLNSAANPLIYFLFSTHFCRNIRYEWVSDPLSAFVSQSVPHYPNDLIRAIGADQRSVPDSYHWTTVVLIIVTYVWYLSTNYIIIVWVVRFANPYPRDMTNANLNGKSIANSNQTQINRLFPRLWPHYRRISIWRIFCIGIRQPRTTSRRLDYNTINSTATHSSSRYQSFDPIAISFWNHL